MFLALNISACIYKLCENNHFSKSSVGLYTYKYFVNGQLTILEGTFTSGKDKIWGISGSILFVVLKYTYTETTGVKVKQLETYSVLFNILDWLLQIRKQLID